MSAALNEFVQHNGGISNFQRFVVIERGLNNIVSNLSNSLPNSPGLVNKLNERMGKSKTVQRTVAKANTTDATTTIPEDQAESSK